MLNEDFLSTSKTTLLFTMFLISLIALQPIPSHSRVIREGSVDRTDSVVAVWNRITLDQVRVHSRRGSRLIEDCARLGAAQSEVDCFSIQQNFWISNFKGEAQFWVQNVVEFAELKAGVFSGTYVFVVWDTADPFRPRFCDPSSLDENYCRAPMYTDPVHLPRSFIFYADLSNDGDRSTLQVKNDFASKSWDIPVSRDAHAS